MQKVLIVIIIFSLLLINQLSCNAQVTTFSDSLKKQENDSINYNKRIIPFSIALGTTGVASTIFLYNAWYKNYPLTNFHFINDNKEWLQMDKAGHVVSSYNISLFMYEGFNWTGISEKKSILYGSLSSFLVMSTIEFFDGLSRDWGASWGDITANTIGIGSFAIQQYVWEEQRIKFKTSAHLSPYAKYRPEVLGETTLIRLLKDYNGQTSWMSLNINSFIKSDKYLPNWLNIAFGYSAKGLIGGYSNPAGLDIHPNNLVRKRQFLLSLDIDLEKINTNSKFLKGAFKTLQFIKIPMPTIIIDKDNIEFSPFYF